MAAALSTTSYAVLGMLSLRSWTPYELTQQIRRSLVYCWPTSERALYSEPEKLVAAGLARVDTLETVSRPRRSYSITPAGREALREWLATMPAAPRVFNEPLLRLIFADQADTADLVRSLSALLTAVTEQHREGKDQMRPYLEGAGPFTDRAHLIAMFADLEARLFTAMEEWAEDAVEEVRSWPTTVGLGLTDDARERLERVLGD